jgi:4-amino-4-deoxy-L-arabinose transferase-like glycosyltransferase
MISLPTINTAKEGTEATWSKNLLWIAILAFALRAAIRWNAGDAYFWTNGYAFFFDLARGIASGQGIAFDGQPSTAFRAPLYPIFLAAVTFGDREFISILLFQSLIGVGIVWCTALIARELFGSAAGLIAAFLTAIYPYYVLHDTALQETSLYTFLTALAVLLLINARRNGSTSNALCAGIALGAAVLTRVTLAPFALLAPLCILVQPNPKMTTWCRRFWLCLTCAVALMLTLSPWLARSYWLFGLPTLSTETGYALWVANNPFTFAGGYPIENMDRSEDIAFSALSPQQRRDIKALGPNEVAVDRWFVSNALNYMRDHPWQTISNGFRKIAAAFCLLPSPRHVFWSNLAYFFTYGPVLILGMLGMWSCRHNWRECLIFYALLITFAGLTAIFYGHTNHRSYLDVYFIVFASSILERFGKRISAWLA